MEVFIFYFSLPLYVVFTEGMNLFISFNLIVTKAESACNASVNSSSAHPPPRANPWALAFFKKVGQIPQGGDT